MIPRRDKATRFGEFSTMTFTRFCRKQMLRSSYWRHNALRLLCTEWIQWLWTKLLVQYEIALQDHADNIGPTYSSKMPTSPVSCICFMATQHHLTLAHWWVAKKTRNNNASKRNCPSKDRQAFVQYPRCQCHLFYWSICFMATHHLLLAHWWVASSSRPSTRINFFASFFKALTDRFITLNIFRRTRKNNCHHKWKTINQQYGTTGAHAYVYVGC